MRRVNDDLIPYPVPDVPGAQHVLLWHQPRAPDLVTWLRVQIESDLGEWHEPHFRAARDRESDHRYFEARERVAQLEAALAILDLYKKQAAKEFSNAMEEDRTWVLAPVVRLLASGYRHRPGYREEWKP